MQRLAPRTPSADAARPVVTGRAGPGAATARRPVRSTWIAITIAFAAAYVALGLFYLVYSLRLPSDGWRLGYPSDGQSAGLVFERNTAGWLSPIEPGDVLLAIDDQPVATIVQKWLTGRPGPGANWRPAGSARYLVRRNDADIVLDVRLEQRRAETPLLVARDSPIDVVGFLLFAVVGIYVFVRVPHRPAAQAMLILGATEIVGLTVHYPLVGAPTATDMFDPIAGPLRLVLGILFYGFYCAFWLNLFLVFPQLKAPMRRYPLLTLIAVYVTPLVPEAVAVLVSVQQPAQFATTFGISLVIDIIAVLVVVVGSLVHSFRTVLDPVRRAQLRWLTFALVIAFPVSSLLGVVNVLWLGDNPIVAAALLLLSGACFPLAIGVAVVRYRLFDIDTIVNRALVYGCLSGILGIAYFIALTLLQAVFRVLTGQTSEWALVGSTLVSAAIANPVRKRLQDLVDRRFYRHKYDAGRTLNSFAATVRQMIDLDALSNNLVSVVQETMQTASVELQIAPTPGALASVQDGEVTTAGVLAVPLVTQGELIGVLSLGPRRGGQGYTVDDRMLLDSLAGQAAPAIRVAQLIAREREEELTRATTELELRLARDIQRSLLPHDLPALAGWRVSAHYQPARAVGGDFYDVLHLADDLLGIAIGDVTNKGVPAALVMATVRTIIRTVTSRCSAPGEILAQLNNQLLPDLPHNMFVTCLVMVLNPETGHLSVATAGHPPPLLRWADGVTEIAATGLPLGLTPGTVYVEHDSHMEPGDVLLAYTDGLVECRNGAAELYGFERLQTSLASLAPGTDGPAIVSGVLGDFTDFIDPRRDLEDDVTLLVVHHVSSGPDAGAVDAGQLR